MRILVAGCLLGLAGSVHCIAMCGPLVAAAASGSRGSRGRVVGFVTYHAGRGLAYQAIGLVAASLGRAFALAGLGAVLSLLCGVMMLAAMMPAGLARRRVAGAWMRPLRRVSGRIRDVGVSKPLLGRFLGGVVNGFLPCGLTYAAALSAAAMSGAGAAAVFMAGFGVGTLPALALVAVATVRCLSGTAAGLRWLPRAACTVAGVLLVARGLAAMGFVPTPLSGPPSPHLHHVIPFATPSSAPIARAR